MPSQEEKTLKESMEIRGWGPWKTVAQRERRRRGDPLSALPLEGEEKNFNSHVELREGIWRAIASVYRFS
jgi:hypothetical protein